MTGLRGVVLPWALKPGCQGDTHSVSLRGDMLLSPVWAPFHIDRAGDSWAVALPAQR
jgi:hypothetical protein